MMAESLGARNIYSYEEYILQLPSTLESSEEFFIHGEIDKCFAFFIQLENIGACIPGCEMVTPIDSNNALFKVKIKVGYISKAFDLKAKLTEVKPNEHLSFSGSGADAEITGNIQLTPAQDKTIRIKYEIEIKAVSVTGKTAMSMIGKDLVKRQASEFAACVKQKLES